MCMMSIIDITSCDSILLSGRVRHVFVFDVCPAELLRMEILHKHWHVFEMANSFAHVRIALHFLRGYLEYFHWVKCPIQCCEYNIFIISKVWRTILNTS